jgi:hypothetical protein
MSDEKKTKEPKQGVGFVATQAILAGDTNEQAFAKVQAAFPEAKTSMASINWYRNKLRQDGKEVKTSRELRAANKPPKEPKAPKAKKQKAADPLA